MNAETLKSLNETGSGAADSIRALLAAVQLDWQRFEELQDERDSHDEQESGNTWAEQCPDDAAELAEMEEAANGCADEDAARQLLDEDPLEVTFRSSWVESGAEMEPSEFCILLTTGGPAVRVIGELDSGSVYRARLEVQDWGTPWTTYDEPGLTEVLMDYARNVIGE